MPASRASAAIGFGLPDSGRTAGAASSRHGRQSRSVSCERDFWDRSRRWRSEPGPPGQGTARIATAGGQSMPVMAGDVIPATGPNPVIMPPLAVGPPGDPQGLGPNAGNGPPPDRCTRCPARTPRRCSSRLPALAPARSAGYGAAPTLVVRRRIPALVRQLQPVNFPLLTTSAPNQSGIIGFPSTIQLVPGEHINYGALSGFRLTERFLRRRRPPLRRPPAPVSTPSRRGSITCSRPPPRLG